MYVKEFLIARPKGILKLLYREVFKSLVEY